jgi:hypothetical protein
MEMDWWMWLALGLVLGYVAPLVWKKVMAE